MDRKKIIARDLFSFFFALVLFLLPPRAFSEETLEVAPDNSQDIYKIPLLQFKLPTALNFVENMFP